MDFNLEAALNELDNFEKETSNVSQLLEDYLGVIAKTGNILFPWNKLQPLLKRKMELVLTEFSKTCPPESLPSLPNTEKFNFDAVKTNMLEAVDSFPNAPFTIQRLCELIVNPRKYYSRTDKYMRGLEKSLLVVSTIDSVDSDQSRSQLSVANGGVSTSADASYEEVIEMDSGITMCSTLPPVNGTVLENFATVFPSATRITPPSNNIQVPVISDSNEFIEAGCAGDVVFNENDSMSAAGSEIIPDSIDEDTSVVSAEFSEALPSEDSSFKNAESIEIRESEALISDHSFVSSSVEENVPLIPTFNSEPSPAKISVTSEADNEVMTETSDLTDDDISTSQSNHCEEPMAKRMRIDSTENEVLSTSLDGVHENKVMDESQENAVEYDKEETPMEISSYNTTTECFDYEKEEMDDPVTDSAVHRAEEEESEQITKLHNHDKHELEHAADDEQAMDETAEMKKKHAKEAEDLNDKIMTLNSFGIEEDEIDETVVKNLKSQYEKEMGETEVKNAAQNEEINAESRNDILEKIGEESVAPEGDNITDKHENRPNDEISAN